MGHEWKQSAAAIALLLSTFTLNADTVYMVDGLAIIGKVKEANEDQVVLLLEDGVVGIPRPRVKRIDYDIESRRKQLSADDFKGHYELALMALEKGRKDVALEELTFSAGKQGVPPQAWKQLAYLMKETGDDKGALGAISEYLKLVPDDEEAKDLKDALLKKLAPPKPGEQPKAGTASKPAEGLQPAKPEGLEDGKWQVEGWGNSATVQVTVSDGNKVLAIIAPKDGKQDKIAVSIARMLNLTGKKKLLFSAHVDGKQPVPMALAFITNDYYESRLITLKPGWNLDVGIDLTGQGFKCRSTNWAFKSEINRLNRVDKLVFLMYNYRAAANIFLDDIRAE